MQSGVSSKGAEQLFVGAKHEWFLYIYIHTYTAGLWRVRYTGRLHCKQRLVGTSTWRHSRAASSETGSVLRRKSVSTMTQAVTDRVTMTSFMISDILSSTRHCHDDDDDDVIDDVISDARRRPTSQLTRASDNVASAAGDGVTSSLVIFIIIIKIKIDNKYFSRKVPIPGRTDHSNNIFLLWPWTLYIWPWHTNVTYGWIWMKYHAKYLRQTSFCYIVIIRT